MRTKAGFTFVAMNVLYSTVEILDDIELLHGYVTGVPYKGGKFTHPATKEVYRIIEVIEQPTKTVIVERV